ncbi:MAG: RpiB/LacA/LacB family sugar-phosphate isomerase [Verrucomicrobiales bacterium]
MQRRERQRQRESIRPPATPRPRSRLTAGRPEGRHRRAPAAGGYEVEDLGTDSAESVDYLEYAHLVAGRVLSGQADAGMLFCTRASG